MLLLFIRKKTKDGCSKEWIFQDKNICKYCAKCSNKLY